MTTHPTCAWLSLNGDCNNRCIWCYGHHSPACQDQGMPLATAIATVQQLALLGVNSLTLLGGEPTLYPHLREVAAEAHQQGMKVSLITNGRVIGQPSFADTLALIDFVAVTIYSIDRKVHNRISGAKSAYDEAMNGILTVVENNKFCAANLVVGNENHNSVIETIELFRRNRLNVIVSAAFPRSCESSQQLDGTHTLDPRRYATLIKKCVEAFGTPRCISYVFEAPLCLLDSDLLMRLRKRGRIGTGCKIGNRINVSMSGLVVGCHAAPATITPLAVEASGAFLPQWRTQIRKFRQKLLLQSPKCNDCKLRHFCQGGCPSTWRYWQLEQHVRPVLKR